MHLRLLARAAPGETPDLGILDQMMVTRDAALPVGVIVFGADVG
jgi:hypothetical protein